MRVVIERVQVADHQVGSQAAGEGGAGATVGGDHVRIFERRDARLEPRCDVEWRTSKDNGRPGHTV
jgi:hypothetical protein